LEDFRNPIYNYGILDQFHELCAGSVHLTVDQQNELLTAAGIFSADPLAGECLIS